MDDDSSPLGEVLPRPLGFVLGGGGSLGAVQVGMLEALSERNITPDLVIGTSVGSLNGEMIALDPKAAASSRCASSTPRVVARVVSGDRSSWLTSEVKRASRSMRSWRLAVIRLNARPAPGGRGRRPPPRGCRAGPRRWSTAASVTSAEGPQRPPARPPADDGAGQGGDQGGPGEGERQDPQGARQLVEREDLEVGGVDRRQRDPDHHLRRPPEHEVLGGRRAPRAPGPAPAGGMALSPTEIEVAYHWPPLREHRAATRAGCRPSRAAG